MRHRAATQRRISKGAGPRPQNSGAYIRLIEAIVAKRNQLCMTQAELGRRLGKTQSYVTKSETRKRRLDFVEMVAFLDALGVSVDEASKLVRSR